MIAAGIFDGDLVVDRSRRRAADGDIVAALLPGPAEDEATVKRLGHDGGRVMLIPENPALEPFEMIDGRILGRVVACCRRTPSSAARLRPADPSDEEPRRGPAAADRHEPRAQIRSQPEALEQLLESARRPADRSTRRPRDCTASRRIWVVGTGTQPARGRAWARR